MHVEVEPATLVSRHERLSYQIRVVCGKQVDDVSLALPLETPASSMKPGQIDHLVESVRIHNVPIGQLLHGSKSEASDGHLHDRHLETDIPTVHFISTRDKAHMDTKSGGDLLLETFLTVHQGPVGVAVEVEYDDDPSVYTLLVVDVSQACEFLAVENGFHKLSGVAFLTPLERCPQLPQGGERVASISLEVFRQYQARWGVIGVVARKVNSPHLTVVELVHDLAAALLEKIQLGLRNGHRWDNCHRPVSPALWRRAKTR